MSKHKGRGKEFRKRMSMVSVTIVVIAIMSVFAYVRIMQVEEQKCWNFMRESAQAVNHEIEIRISDNVNILRLIADQLLQEEMLDNKDTVIARLRSTTKITMFDRIDIMYPDGTFMTPIGVRRNTANVPPFSKIAEIGICMSQRVRDIVKDEPVLRYYIPVKENGKTRAIMIGVIDCSTLYKTFKTTAFEGQADCYLVDSNDGNMIMGQAGQKLGNVNELKHRTLRSDYANVDLPTEIRKNCTGAVAYESEYDAKQYYYMYYTPVGMFDWELLVVVRENIAFASLVEIKRILMYVAIVEAFLLALYFYWNVHSIKVITKSKKRAEKELLISTTLLQSIRALTSHTNMKHSIHDLLEIICNYFEGDRAYICLLDYENDTVSCQYEHTKDGVIQAKELLQNRPMQMVDIWISRFKENGEFYLSNIDKVQKYNPETYQLLKKQDIRSLVAVPLMEGDTIMGFFGVDNPGKNYQDLSLMSSAAFFITDTLEKQARNELLNRLSFEDSLTGLNNRNKYNQILDKHGNQVVLKTGTVFFDLNGLKKMNDTYGHEAGDKLIKNAAKHIGSVFGEDAFRIGGDEFTVVMIDIEKDVFTAKVEEALQQMKEAGISTSAGMAWHDGDITLTAQLQEADQKMYEDKEHFYQGAPHR